MVTTTIDYAPFNAAMDEVYNAMIGAGKDSDAQNLVWMETKRLALNIVRDTPPPKLAGGEAAGKAAITKDLYSLISEAPPEMLDRISAKYGTSEVETWHTKKGGEQEKIRWEHIARSVEELPDLHNKYRGKRGRPYRLKKVQGQWKSRIVVDKGIREQYIKRVQANLGRWKAKWALCAFHLGATIPKWISRHFDYVAARGAVYQPNLEDKLHPNIVFGGSGPDFKRNQALIERAIKIRAKAMSKRAALMLSDYKDWRSLRSKTKSRQAYGHDPIDSEPF